MFGYLITGVILGLSAGFAPGPLLTLVISETLQHDIAAGIKVALSPLITDLPIIALAFFFVSELSNIEGTLGIISLIGGAFVYYIGYQSIRSRGVKLDLNREKPNSLAKGILVNALSPHPYLFWISVGSPTLIKAMPHGIPAPFAFLFGFYSMLVGSKVLLAIATGKSGSFLRGRAYIYTIRMLGFALWLLATILIYDGLVLLGLL